MSRDTYARTFTAGLLLLAGCSSAVAGAEALAQQVCGNMASARPAGRPGRAPTGSEFVREIRGLSDDQRELAILEQALRGNLPAFLRHSEPVTLAGRAAGGVWVAITLCVAPDYLAIGSDTDYLYVPMRLTTALAVASHYDSLLPTRTMVDAIYAQARVHLQPQPLPAGDTMRTTGYYWRHSELVREQRQSFAEPPGTLTAGDKKDLVLTNRFWTNLGRVAIYGWHLVNGRPIQPLSTVHGARYADYSHGVRLISATAYVNGVAAPLLNLLQDPRLASLLSDEGVIRNAAGLVRILQWRPVTSAGGPTAHQVEEIPVVGKAEEPRSQLTAPFPIDFAHPIDQMLHQ